MAKNPYRPPGRSGAEQPRSARHYAGSLATLNTATVLVIAGLSVLAAIFACLLGLVSAISGSVAGGFLWLAAAMLAVLFAAFIIVANGPSDTTDDDSAQLHEDE